MGTISKALGKYREQRKHGHIPPQMQTPGEPERDASEESGRSVSEGTVSSADGSEAVRPPAALHQPRPPKGLTRVPAVESGPGADGRHAPDVEARPGQAPPPAAAGPEAPQGQGVENRPGTGPPPAATFHDKLVVITKPYSFEAEQFKLLRSSLMFPTSGPPPRSILVTSTDPGEGKTLVSANLAASIALNLDRYVLLIDCDLRRPFLHKLLGVGERPGLSEYLSGCCPLESLLLKTPLDRFSFLSAGQIPVNPAELLNSDKMFGLMTEVRDRYADRLVIIDSPPPMLASESNALARAVDGVLLVIKYRATKREDAAELVEKIGKEKILGTVMNFTDREALGYYRAKKYGYKYYNQASS